MTNMSVRIVPVKLVFIRQLICWTEMVWSSSPRLRFVFMSSDESLVLQGLWSRG